MAISAEKVVRKIDFLKGQRGNWETHWQELADYVLPRKDNITRNRNPGEKVNQFLLDNTSLQSNVLLAGFLHGLLTNPNTQFFELTTGKRDIDDQDDVRLWLQDTSKAMMNVLNNSNFQTEVHELYIDLGCFGTSLMTIEEDKETIVRFGTRPIQSLFVAEDNKGRITEVYRVFKWDVNQIVQEFGEDILKKSKDLTKKFKESDVTKVNIAHAVYPDEVDPRKRGKNPWVSQYILVDEKTELRLSSFAEFPFVVPRWSKNSGEVYGRSPAMNALPESKTLNLMTETVIKGAQKTVDPPLMVPDDGFLGTIRTRPGSINFYRSGTPDRIETVFNDARIDFGFQVVEEGRQRIRDAFFVDQLRLKQGAPQMTATEVEQRIEDSLRFMGPVLGRQQSELLRPLIDRVFGIMMRKGLIEDPPEVLRGSALDVQYSSLIARTQRQQEAQAILRTIEQATPFISADPSILDNLDGNKALRLLARINSMPQEILRDQEEVEEIRGARAEQEQAQVEQESNAATADNIAKVSPALQGLG